MILSVIFAILLLVTVILLFGLIFNGIILFVKYIRKEEKKLLIRRLKKILSFSVIVVLLSIGTVVISQFFAYTPKIENPNSISELRQVSLNGRKEWISIRGKNKNDKLILFLAGGPGGSQIAAVRHDLAKLEENFVVVTWDQAGSGKSYDAVKSSDITVKTYIDDGYELTKYLCKAFKQEKISLIGESWGSALGILLIDKSPELYNVFIGTGQMVDFRETEIIDYKLAMKIAGDKNDIELIEKLKKNGLPPYYGKDVTWKSASYLNYLSSYMMQNPEIKNSGYNTFRDLFSSEYGLLDKANYLRGVINTFNNVYQQLYDIDLRKDYSTLKVPVYFFIGRHDVNAPISLLEDYYTKLSAPKKEIVWFEHSGHSPWINESDIFVSEVNRAIKESN